MSSSLITSFSLLMQSTSDFTIKVQGKPIHVHKVILNIRCQHFKNMFHYNWLVHGQR